MKKRNKKFVVRYQLPYVHEVVVGIEAPNRHIAEKRAERLFNRGTIWDDTERVPLLRDEFDEGQCPDVLEFEASEVKDFPEPDGSVYELRRREHAQRACALLVTAYDRASTSEGASIDWSDLDNAYLSACAAGARRPRRLDGYTGWRREEARVLVIVRGGVAEAFTSGAVATAVIDLDNAAAGEACAIPDGFEELAEQAGIVTTGVRVGLAP